MGYRGLSIKHYRDRRTGNVVEAVSLSAKNVQQVAEWVEGWIRKAYARTSTPLMLVHTRDSALEIENLLGETERAEEGDYIVRVGDEKRARSGLPLFRVYRKEVFEEIFEEVSYEGDKV